MDTDSQPTRFARLREHFHRLIDVPLPLLPGAMAQVEPELREELAALLGHVVPETVGPFRIERELGRGGMGVVYLARRVDGAFEQRVALKRMHMGLGPERAQRFARERHILARLQHPHIAKLLDGGIDDHGQPWLAMEYIEGRPLINAVRGLSLDARLGVLIDLCLAVAHAHAALVIHRDIKPGNVLLATDGHPRLLDFGIAKLEDDSDLPATLTDLRPMTPRYAAPEQRRGERATTAVDIYALGALAAEVLATEVSGSLKRIVATACAERPEARYATVAAMADDLIDARAGRPLHSGIDSRRERALAFARTHVWPLSTALISVLALATGGLVAWQQAQRAAREAEQTRQHLATLIDVIAAVSPDRYRGQEPPAGDVLLAAADALANRSHEQPLLATRGLSELGAGLINLGRTEDAQRVLQRAVDVPGLAPQQALDAMRLLALVSDELTAARALADRIAALAPRAPRGPASSALGSIAATLARLGDVPRARALLARAELLSGPMSVEDEENYRRQRAQTLMRTGDLDGAAIAWRDVVGLHRDHADAFSAERQAEAAWMRADLALALGQLDLAQSELERARPTIESAFPDTHEERAKFDLSRAELRLQRGEDASALLQSVLARLPSDSNGAARARALLAP